VRNPTAVALSVAFPVGEDENPILLEPMCIHYPSLFIKICLIYPVVAAKPVIVAVAVAVLPTTN
jgi:hypothetical protein